MRKWNADSKNQVGFPELLGSVFFCFYLEIYTYIVSVFITYNRLFAKKETYMEPSRRFVKLLSIQNYEQDNILIF